MTEPVKARTKPPRLGPLPRPAALALLGIWAALTLFATFKLLATPPISAAGLDTLTPVEHRPAGGRPIALLRVDHQALAETAAQNEDAPELDPRTVLAEAGFEIEEAMGAERVPHAPPRTEITRWLDAHALYLLPVEAHAKLEERLSDERMQAEVQGLKARMSSPLFSVSGEQPRRDPLAIQELTAGAAGQLGHVASVPGSAGPQVGANGDLIAAGGDRALVQLVSTRAPEALLADLRAAVAGLPVEVELVAPERREQAARASVAARWWSTLAACFAALILVLSLVMRRLVPVLALGLCLASAWLLTSWALGGLDLLGAALMIVLLGFGCDAALRLRSIGLRGWAAPLMLAGALAPLWLSPYPGWQRWALIWAAAYLGVAVIMRGVFPVLLALLRADFEWRKPGFRLAAMPAAAIVACLGLSLAGAWSTQELRYRPGTRLPLAEAELGLADEELAEHFFDPAMIVEARSWAPEEPEAGEALPPTPEAAALEASAPTAARLAELVPGRARRVDTPGSFVIREAELEARHDALAELGLEERMDALSTKLVDQGLRAEAFAEFVRGAADIDDLPSAQAALDGPLGPWIRGYLVEGEGGRIGLRARVELRGHDGLPLAPIREAELDELPHLRGPAMAAMIDQRSFDSRLGVVVLAGLWLTAFMVWLATTRLSDALAVALVAVAAECGVLAALQLLEQPVGPHLLPVLALVGAAAGVAGGRACGAVLAGRPIVARGVLLTGACQVVAGLVLLSSGQPLWQELGLALAIGSALACGLGLFAAPGLASLLARLGGRRRKSKARGKSKTKPEPEPESEPEPEPEPEPEAEAESEGDDD